MDNPALGRKVLDFITGHPDQFDMSIWGASDYPCGTTACLAGWSMLMSGYTLSEEHDVFYRPDGSQVRGEGNEAAGLLGLSGDAVSLFVMDEEPALARFRALVEASEAAAAAGGADRG